MPLIHYTRSRIAPMTQSVEADAEDLSYSEIAKSLRYLVDESDFCALEPLARDIATTDDPALAKLNDYGYFLCDCLNEDMLIDSYDLLRRLEKKLTHDKSLPSAKFVDIVGDVRQAMESTVFCQANGMGNDKASAEEFVNFTDSVRRALPLLPID